MERLGRVKYGSICGPVLLLRGRGRDSEIAPTEIAIALTVRSFDRSLSTHLIVQPNLRAC